MSKAAFFDIDGTLLRGESQFSFLLWCIRRGMVPLHRSLPVVARYAGYLAGVSADARKLRTSGYRLFQGLPVSPIEKEAEAFFHENLAHRFRLHAKSLVETHRARGHLIVLITSTCHPVARVIATRLQPDTLIATNLVTAAGVFTGERELPEPYSKGKRILVEKFCTERGIIPAECFAYTDHHSDISILEFVGHPTAVNPTKRLTRTCARRGWNVVDLECEQPKVESI